MLRHLVSNASMIAHLATLAPGRIEIGVGTGFTSAVLLGRRPSRWAEVERFVAALRELLAGREVEWDGQVVCLLQGEACGVRLPVEVPSRSPWRSAACSGTGPKGRNRNRRRVWLSRGEDSARLSSPRRLFQP